MLSDMQDAGIEILYSPGVNKKIEMMLNNSDARGNMSLLWNEKELLSITGKIADSENP